MHKTNIKYERYRNSTTLSFECWRIKDKGGNPKVSWKKIGHAPSYSVETKRCLLCLREKFEIANYPGKDLLNKRSEIIAKCRHRKKFMLIGPECTWLYKRGFLFTGLPRIYTVESGVYGHSKFNYAFTPDIARTCVRGWFYEMKCFIPDSFQLQCLAPVHPR